ncbi:MAG: hypothetical protein R3C68_11950 [Myxococcota bacterium]
MKGLCLLMVYLGVPWLLCGGAILLGRAELASRDLGAQRKQAERQLDKATRSLDALLQQWTTEVVTARGELEESTQRLERLEGAASAQDTDKADRVRSTKGATRQEKQRQHNLAVAQRKRDAAQDKLDAALYERDFVLARRREELTQLKQDLQALDTAGVKPHATMSKRRPLGAMLCGTLLMLGGVVLGWRRQDKKPQQEDVSRVEAPALDVSSSISDEPKLGISVELALSQTLDDEPTAVEDTMVLGESVSRETTGDTDDQVGATKSPDRSFSS